VTARDRVSDLVPFLQVADVDRSVAFYELLGFEMLHEFAPDGPGPDRQMRVDDPDGYCLMVAEIEGERVGVVPD
jgi:catechol 2,3-dioxygenase-like lactoylglutathione lyase family enzyme